MDISTKTALAGRHSGMAKQFFLFHVRKNVERVRLNHPMLNV